MVDTRKYNRPVGHFLEEGGEGGQRLVNKGRGGYYTEQSNRPQLVIKYSMAATSNSLIPQLRK